MKNKLEKKLSEREELIYKVDKLLSASDIRQVKIFIAGIEAGKSIQEESEWTPDYEAPKTSKD